MDDAKRMALLATRNHAAVRLGAIFNVERSVHGLTGNYNKCENESIRCCAISRAFPRIWEGMLGVRVDDDVMISSTRVCKNVLYLRCRKGLTVVNWLLTLL